MKEVGTRFLKRNLSSMDGKVKENSMSKKEWWEKYFDANWEVYLTDALALYVASENWVGCPKTFAKADYKKLKKHIKGIIERQRTMNLLKKYKLK